MKRIILWGLVLLMPVIGALMESAQQFDDPPPPTASPSSLSENDSTEGWPVTMSTNLIDNMNFERDDFGLVWSWSQTDVDLQRWYLVQNVPPDQPHTQWTDWIDLSEEKRGHVLRSIDKQDCSNYCSSEAIQIVPAEPNTFYVLTAYSRIVEGSSPTLYLDFLDADFNRIEVYTRGGYGEEWSRQTVAATAPLGTRYIRVILYLSNTAQGTVYWDKVALHSLSAPLVPPEGMINVAAEKPVIARGGGVTYGENWNDAADYNTTTLPNGGSWGNQTNPGTFETVDLGRVYNLEGMGYALGWDNRFRSPLTFQIDVSLDNSEWTMVAQVIHQPVNNDTSSTYVEVELPIPPTAARYVRYSEPARGAWNGWGHYFYLRAYTRSTEPAITPTAAPVISPTAAPTTTTGSTSLRVETLTVPFDRYKPTYTEYAYTGSVILVLAGTGQAAGMSYSDAFYLYTDADGRQLEIPQTEMFDLEIDGQRAIYTLGMTGHPPPFNPQHVYAVTFDAGPRPRRIAFRISDEIVDDNTGQFTITVIQP